MKDENISNEKERMAFISYLDERNEIREGFVTIIKFDSFLVKFKTNNNNIITIPTARILKVKEKEGDII